MKGKGKVEEFMRYLRYEKRYSSHTLVAYENDLIQFTTYLKSQYQIEDLSKVQPTYIRSWVFELVELKRGKKTINRKISSLRSFYEFLKKKGSVESNPVLSIPQIKTSHLLPDVIPENVLKNYFQFSNQHSWQDIRDRMLISLLYETGMRRSELMELKWKDVDFHSHYIIVMGKRQKQRQIPIRKELSERLKEFQKKTTDEFNTKGINVMVTDRGAKVYPKWIYNKVKATLGLWSNSERISPHILRHSIATHLLNAGADLQIIREFLGHSTLAATEIYTHNSIGKLKKAYKKALPDLDAIEAI